MYLILDDKWETNQMGLEMTGFYIPMPEPKTNLIDISTGNGNIDLTEMRGFVPYADRSGVQFTFDIKDGTYKKWLETYGEIAEKIHGRKVKVRCSEDPMFYYRMRLNTDSTKTNPFVSQLTFSGTADPFRYGQTKEISFEKTQKIKYDGITETPCTLSITPSSVLSKLTITGLSEKPIIINRLEANKAIVIDGEQGKVTCEGANANKFGDYDAWEFPRLLPGENTVTLDSDICQVTITYKPLYL